MCRQEDDGHFRVELEIKDAKEADYGTYVLKARNEKGETVSSGVTFTAKDLEEEKDKVEEKEEDDSVSFAQVKLYCINVNYFVGSYFEINFI